MNMPTIPKSMAQQTITYRVKSKKPNVKGHYEYVDTNVDHVVVQQAPVYSGSNNNREVVANAVVFLYANVSSPLPKLDVVDSVGDKIVFEWHEYTVKTIVENRNPYSNEIWSYEVEVL